MSAVRSLRKAIKTAGGRGRFAREMRVTRQAIEQWFTRGIPAERVMQIERLTGIPRHELRPDIYPRPNGRSQTA